jgi:DNA-binding response OmpR family regulator
MMEGSERMRRILVVDDSVMMRALYKQTLARVANVSVRYASDGDAALAEIRAEEPDLVFLDINMPNLDGFEVLSGLRSSGTLERLKVVLVSTEGTAEDVERGRIAGAVDYLRKPFSPGELVVRVELLVPSRDLVSVRPGSVRSERARTTT